MGGFGTGLWLAAQALGSALAATPAAAPASLEVEATKLAPGQYLWRDSDPANGEIAVVISRTAQMAYVFRGDRLIGAASVSTGKPGKTTPLGDFTVLQKKVFHRSNIYSNAPMPYMQRLTWTGIALHAGHNPGYPASHGCIRLPRAFAVLLYNVTKLGAAVAVVDGDRVVPLPAEDFPVIIADLGDLGGDSDAEVTWRPVAFAEPRHATVRIVAGDEKIVPEAPLFVAFRRRAY
jgi:hypothetical protein